MPTPIGHIMIAEMLSQYKGAGWSNTLAGFAISAGLVIFSDIDMLWGLALNGNAGFYHREITHSVFFAFMAGPFIASLLTRLGHYAFTSRRCILLLFSHSAGDYLIAPSPIRLFWPWPYYPPMPHVGYLRLIFPHNLEWPWDDIYAGGMMTALFCAVLLIWRAYRQHSLAV